MKISYINLGTHLDKVTNECVPTLPTNDSPLEIVDLKTLWLSQKTMNKDDKKGMNGMIFPFCFNKLYSIEKIESEKLCNNGIVFVDVDCGGELAQTIFDKLEECNNLLSGSIIAGVTTRNGLHLLFKSDPMTTTEYKTKVCGYLTAFAFSVLKVTGIDLRSIPKALDSCTFSIKQRLFLRYSNNIYWNDYASNTKMDEKTKQGLIKEYPELWKKVLPRSTYSSLKRSCTGEVLNISDIQLHEYIPHHLRWSLFDSLCCCYDSEESVMTQWNRCCDLIDPVEHSAEFFKKEPIRNHWYDKFTKSTNKICNKDLLYSFGYQLKEMKITWMPNSIDDLLKI